MVRALEALKLLSDWNHDLARAIGKVGGDDFFPAVIEAVKKRVAISYPEVRLYHKDLPPRVLYHQIPAAEIGLQIKYLEGPYREDPFFQTSIKRPKNKLYRLSQLTAGRLETSDYYRNYYAHTGIVDEAIFLSKLAGGNVLNLSIKRLPHQGAFTEDDYQLLYSLADPISELFHVHSECDNFAITNLLQPGIEHQINLAFRTFGSSLLSPREREVLELMLRGHGTDTSATRLSITRETVRRHRKNLYRKLDVSSQTDLFSLFLNSMSYLGEAGGGDPLTVYMGPSALSK